ncbi:MAG: aminotransferase class I/II-fold pyridoxal phosphate-dependent enzyme [Gemmatimonadales bacterium]|jgi:histidinol-phosphate aminotransferase
MERRDFLRTGFALGAGIGATGVGGVGIFPDPVHAYPTRAAGPLELNSNENPLGLAPEARRAVIYGVSRANRYPGERMELAQELAAINGVREENIVLGCGSTEVLQMAVQALSAPDARLILAEPTYEDVPWYCQPFPYKLEKVPLDGRFAHDLAQMKERAAAAPGRVVVYICNPNNPTGTLTPSAEVDAWIESAAENTRFLVDEAYYEYCEDPAYWTSNKWIGERRNVIVTRTFSKIYAMAGMRLGYGIAHPETADLLRSYIGRNNANHLALVAALASLRDSGLIERSRRANAEGKRILYECLDELGLEYLPSHTNFVLHRISGELRTYRTRMRERDILVGRPFPPMLEYNRLSIGSAEEMLRFTEVLREFRGKGWV